MHDSDLWMNIFFGNYGFLTKAFESNFDLLNFDKMLLFFTFNLWKPSPQGDFRWIILSGTALNNQKVVDSVQIIPSHRIRDSEDVV